MQDIVTFDYFDTAIRAVMLDGDPWFVAADIAAILGYSEAAAMVRSLDDDESVLHNLQTSTQSRAFTIISESGLYNAIFRSRRDEARAFRRWVTGTVLPELRRTGCFAVGADPATPPAPLDAVDTTRFSLALSAVSLMRKLRGNAAALALWDRLGLPAPGCLDALADARTDALPARIALWADTRDAFTNDEIAAAMGLPHPDADMRRRFGDVLRTLGFDLRRTRRGAGLAWCWRRAGGAA